MMYDFDFGYDFNEINRAKNFSEYDESAWDYFDDDEFYERTQNWDIPYNGEDWSESGRPDFKFQFEI